MSLENSIKAAGGRLPSGRNYSRLFRERGLRSWEPEGLDLEEKLATMENLARPLFDAKASEDPPRDLGLPAGYAFFAQFVTHDVSFGAPTRQPLLAHSRQLPNLRTPSFDLDSLYGNGPSDAPYMYDPDDSGRFLVGRNETGEPDLPRVQDRFGRFRRLSRAVIGDPRNDENVIISQIHLAFL